MNEKNILSEFCMNEVRFQKFFLITRNKLLYLNDLLSLYNKFNSK